jgi:hypothetical protein
MKGSPMQSHCMPYGFTFEYHELIENYLKYSTNLIDNSKWPET